MNKLSLVLLAFLASFQLIAQDPKVLSEVTVVYDLTVDGANNDPNRSLAGTTKVVYIKGSKTRTELTTPAFQQVVLFDSKSDTTIVLRELGNAKYLSYLDEKKRDEKNKKFEGMTFTATEETKTILGYECKRTIAKLKDGSSFNIYYAPSIVPSNKGYESQFRDLPGFALEYEAQSEDGKTKVRYSASKISLTPVPVAKFDVPKSGYRVL